MKLRTGLKCQPEEIIDMVHKQRQINQKANVRITALII
jgi:hypothetical protein